MRRQQAATSRRVAFELLEKVEFDDAYANLALPKLLTEANLTKRDSALAQELAFGTIRWQLFYDEVIEIAAKRPLEEIDADALLILRLGAHQILGMRTAVHAALSETVELAKQVLPQRLVGFTNAVLRRVSEKGRDSWMQKALAGLDDENDRLAVSQSHPVWMVRALRQALKIEGREHELKALLACNNEPARVDLVALPSRLTVEQFLKNHGNLLPATRSPFAAVLESGAPSDLDEIRDGIARVQDQGSQLMAIALVDQRTVAPGEQWLDMCAGPGGKAALLASLAELTDAKLLCNESQPHRAKLVEQAITAVSSHAKVQIGDGRAMGERLPNRFDRILLDAPCSGLGALRRRPEARWRKSPNDIAELVQLQRELLASAAKALKAGGLLAYVTCSPHPSETAAQVDWVQKNLTDLELVQISSNHLPIEAGRKTVQLWPHVQGTDAMFIAMFQKKTAAG